MIYNISDFVLLAAQRNMGIGALGLEIQAMETNATQAHIYNQMVLAWQVMQESIAAGLDKDLRSISKKTGGQAYLLYQRALNSPPAGIFLAKACAYAMAVAEYNAAMGKIVAAPTAGASGILPGVLLSAKECHNLCDKEIIMALFSAGALGSVIAREGTISGAEGGCQAECGSAAAMAAGALVELLGGTPKMAAHACAFALMNALGLICDPVDGLVEIPCVYRNVGGIGNALTSANMALAGLTCPIPADEMIQAMKDVGDAMPASLRETGEGGCAACPSMHCPSK